MSVVVFGSRGLLGSHISALYPEMIIPISREECDITDVKQVDKVLKVHRPTAVINAAGRVKCLGEPFDVNWVGPQTLSKVCDQWGVKLIHISTDCVFKGDRGNYYETDTPDAEDTYGKSKVAGEVTHNPHLTIRSSFIGWPDPTKRGLLNWLYYGKWEKRGYTKAIWNGVTTTQLAEFLMEYVINNSWLTGLYHYGAQGSTSKFKLLELARDVFMWDKCIIQDESVQYNRTLRTERLARDYKEICNKSYLQQLEEMRAKEWRIQRYLKSL